MSKQTKDLLSICAGLDTAYIATGKRGQFINQAVSRFFDKAESVLTPLATRHPSREI